MRIRAPSAGSRHDFDRQPQHLRADFDGRRRDARVGHHPPTLGPQEEVRAIVVDDLVGTRPWACQKPMQVTAAATWNSLLSAQLSRSWNASNRRALACIMPSRIALSFEDAGIADASAASIARSFSRSGARPKAL